MSQQAMQQALNALNHIVCRLQMDIDDGGRPDHWSMEDLVRKANPAIATLEKELALHTAAQTKVALTSDDLHWFEDAFRAWENNDFVGVLDGLNAAVSHFVGTPLAIEANDAKDAAWQMKEASEPVQDAASVDTSEIERVLGYLRTDEAEIRAAKVNATWADTMARASDHLRAYAQRLKAGGVEVTGATESVDWKGLAMDLEAQAKRVESQTVERAMLAAAHGLRLMGGSDANDAKDAAWVKRIRELVEQLCSAAVAYGEHDTKDAENAYYAAKAHLIDACGAEGKSNA